MKTKIFSTVILLILIIQACYEDKGNYSYLTLNEVKPKTGNFRNYSYQAYIGERYRYYPQLDYTNPSDTTHFEFWWEYTAGARGGDTICIGRELDFIPTVADYINMQLCVLDTRNGIISTHFLQLQGVSALAKGWAILGEKDGKSIVSLIRPEYKEETGPDGEKIKTRVYTKFDDIYGSLQGGEIGSHPLQLRQLLNYLNSSALLVLQKENSVYLNGATYAKEMELAKEFAGGIPSGFEAKDFFFGTGSDAIVSANGEVYTRTTRQQAEFQPFYLESFANIPTEYKGKKVNATSIIQAVPTLAQCYGIYEAANKRILWMIADRNQAASILPATMPEPAEGQTLIDLNNFGDWELLYCGSFSEQNTGLAGTAYYISLFKKGGQIFMQQFKTTTEWPSYESVLISDLKSGDFSGKQYVTDNTKFYMLKTRPYLFFAEGNVIYWYDLNSGVTKDFYRFPAGSAVVDMGSNPQESELGLILEDGTFATLNIENDKLYDGIKIWETSGFEKCIDLEYKFANYGQYASRSSSGNWD